MAAVAKRESNPDAFVGQVLARSSPILTWRPALVAKVSREAVAVELSASAAVEDRESSVHRISRAPTRRMVAWPVIRQVQRSHTPSAWELVRRAGIAVLAGAAVVAISVVAYSWEARGEARMSPPVAKVLVAHVIDPGFDVLIPPAMSAEAIATPTANTTLAANPTPTSPPRSPAPSATLQRGRAHHGHRHTAASR